MRTWSAEHALDGLLTGLGNVAGISASAILEILWPTPVDPAEQLAEREAGEEVAEPRYVSVWEKAGLEMRDGEDVPGDAEPKLAPMPCCGGVLFHHHCPEANARRAADVGPTITGIKRRVRDFGADFIGPVVNECEPALSDDELVAVRGLIQERYADAVEQDTRTIFNIPNNSSSQTWGVNPGDESAPHSQAVASPATVGEPPDPAVAGRFNDGDCFDHCVGHSVTTHQKSEHCWCGEHINAEGSEESVLFACTQFRAYHSHRNPNK